MGEKTRIIMCGGRAYKDERTVHNVLKSFESTDVVIVHGDAPGADTLVDRQARFFGFEVDPFPADWNRYGRAAGPIRNKEMLESGAHLVIAFPGHKGTRDMMTQAEQHGVPVLKVGIWDDNHESRS